MKTKAIVATLLVAAAASAHARLAPPFPRKAVPPDESGYWIVINGSPWSRDVKSKFTTFADGQTRRGESVWWRTGPAKNRRQLRKKSAPRGRDFTTFVEQHHEGFASDVKATQLLECG